MDNKTHSYKKISHFNDILNVIYEPNKIISYTNKEFEEDLKKWFIETKTIQNNKIKFKNKVNYQQTY